VTAYRRATTPPTVAAPAPADAAALVTRLSDAVARDPGDLASWQSLGSAAVRAAATGDPSYYDVAERAFDRADAIAPDRGDTLVGRAALALALHEFDEALRLAERVHTRAPDNPDALLAMVDALVELGHYDRAVAAADELLTVKPDLSAYARVSYLRELHGDLDGAVAAMREALVAGADRPDDTASVLTFLGDLELARGRPAAALREYERALDRDNDLPLARLGHATALAAGAEPGDRRKAITELDRLVVRYPLPAAAALLGDLQADAGRHGDAARSRELVRTVARLQQDAGVVVDLDLALFEADHGSPRTALRLARDAYAARPHNVFAADALAWARYRAGDVAGARGLVDRALRLGTESALLRYHAAAILAATGETEFARVELTRALERNPWFSFALRDEASALAARLGVATRSAWADR
jgi:tetratricopeptide (TPR) repeat protein